jgi:hypothetical protein
MLNPVHALKPPLRSISIFCRLCLKLLSGVFLSYPQHVCLFRYDFLILIMFGEEYNYEAMRCAISSAHLLRPNIGLFSCSRRCPFCVTPIGWGTKPHIYVNQYTNYSTVQLVVGWTTGVRSLVKESNLSLPSCQIGLGTHPATCSVFTESKSCRRVKLTAHLHLA